MRMSPWGVEKSRKWCSEIHRFKNEQQAGGKERGRRAEGREVEKEFEGNKSKDESRKSKEKSQMIKVLKGNKQCKEI